MRLGRYELLYRLAKGGMGEVFLARRKGPGDIEKRVVIKRIRQDLSGDPRFVDMFLREARVSMTLSHRNIAAVFDFGRAGRELFLAMEHVHGRDLARALSASRKAGSSLSTTAALHIALEVCRALDYAHRAANRDGDPIIHRDLSPKNILLSFSGEVVVADFGLAVESSEHVADGAVRGTPAYLSPEQARGGRLDTRADLFSLGLVLRELIVGEPAYRGGGPAQIVEQAKAAELEPLPDDVPPLLAEVIARATAADPDERYQDVRSMQSALDELLVAERAAGAGQPGREIATWLGALFDSGDPAEEASGSSGTVAAVTYLDDGAEAVSKEIRDLGDATLASLALTVGDPSAASGASPGRIDDEPRASRMPLTIIGLVASAALVVGGVWMLGGDDDARDRPTVAADAAPLRPSDASPSPPPDAAQPDAAAVPVDAAKPARLSPGSLRVQSRPWATVKVRGGGSCPETPCVLELKPGRYQVLLRNPVTGASATRRVTITSGVTSDISVTLREPK